MDKQLNGKQVKRICELVMQCVKEIMKVVEGTNTTENEKVKKDKQD